MSTTTTTATVYEPRVMISKGRYNLLSTTPDFNVQVWWPGGHTSFLVDAEEEAWIGELDVWETPTPDLVEELYYGCMRNWLTGKAAQLEEARAWFAENYDEAYRAWAPSRMRAMQEQIDRKRRELGEIEANLEEQWINAHEKVCDGCEECS